MKATDTSVVETRAGSRLLRALKKYFVRVVLWCGLLGLVCYWIVALVSPAHLNHIVIINSAENLFECETVVYREREGAIHDQMQASEYVLGVSPLLSQRARVYDFPYRFRDAAVTIRDADNQVLAELRTPEKGLHGRYGYTLFIHRRKDGTFATAWNSVPH